MWIEVKYIRLLKPSLKKFKEKTPKLFNFRCPYCGDSTKSKTKSRGYLLSKGAKFHFYCHNCHQSTSFNQFLKHINPALYDTYLLESFEAKRQNEIFLPEKKPKYPVQLISLRKISQLDADNPMKQYIINRQIPTPYHAKLYYCDKFKTWVNSIIPNKFNNTNYDKPRIIIPMFYQNELVGFQGRSIDPQESIRYISIMLDESKPKIFGLDTVDLNRKYYVFEGPFDSMFIPNSIATCGRNLVSELETLDMMKNNAVIVYDNEPRNAEVVKNILSAIKKGYKVCIWPDTTVEKDINEMVLKKIGGDYVKTELISTLAEKIKNVIDTCTFKGLEAELRLAEWKKV